LTPSGGVFWTDATNAVYFLASPGATRTTPLANAIGPLFLAARPGTEETFIATPTSNATDANLADGGNGSATLLGKMAQISTPNVAVSGATPTLWVGAALRIQSYDVATGPGGSYGGIVGKVDFAASDGTDVAWADDVTTVYVPNGKSATTAICTFAPTSATGLAVARGDAIVGVRSSVLTGVVACDLSTKVQTTVVAPLADVGLVVAGASCIYYWAQTPAGTGVWAHPLL
jgi:hypothetical protein